MPMNRTAVWSTLALLLVGCVGPTRVDRSLRAKILAIRAIDHHAHPESVEPLDPNEVEPANPLGDVQSPLPSRVRPGAPRWRAAWRALYGAAPRPTSTDELRALWRTKRSKRREMGERWPEWV